MTPLSSWQVLKFGGTSVSSPENWERIAQIVQEQSADGYRVCVVHSALEGVSNALQAIINSGTSDEATEIALTIEQQHLRLGQLLGIDASPLLDPYFRELRERGEAAGATVNLKPEQQADLLALGELMATRLGNAYLNTKAALSSTWKDARELLESTPQENETREQAVLSAVCESVADEQLQTTLAKATPVICTQGFIARDIHGQTVLLGRGGSDVSAAYFAAKLQAKRLEIWTDVPGLFTANPTQISSARLLEQLNYEEAQEIATNGARVLHPRCLYPARRHHIPIHVRCTQKPELAGTIISDEAAGKEGVKMVALRRGVTLVSMESLDMWRKIGFLADAFSVFKQFGLSIDLVSTSESNVTVSLDSSLNLHFKKIKAEFVEALSAHCSVKVIESVSAVSLVGRRIRSILHQLGEAFKVFQEHQIYLVSQAANDLNFTFVVESGQADRLVRQLHERVISQSGNRPELGNTWEELMHKNSSPPVKKIPWWQRKRRRLIRLAKQHGSVYAYSPDEIAANISRLKRISAVDRYFYAIKANANDHVLQKMYASGLGFECVSIGEVERVLAHFPDINRDRILFTPNFAPRTEYEQGFVYGVHVTLDNIYPLEQWGEVFRDQAFFLRIDPGHGEGHHQHVRTGGIRSKFGIPRVEIEAVKRRIDQLNATVTGLHAHVGSGIKNPAMWQETAVILHKVAQKLGGVPVLDLGGGLGIREHESERSLDLRAVQKSLKQFRSHHPEYTLWMEPGRFLIASAGVLLSPVTQLKGKGEVRYVGVETGMNSLIRPALYGASHTIANLSNWGAPLSQNVNIVGPICESGDKLGIDRRFPDSQEGDIICIANTGAYGYVMSSNYNLRAPAKEVMLDD